MLKKKQRSFVPYFWLAFFTVVGILFFVQRKAIFSNIQDLIDTFNAKRNHLTQRPPDAGTAAAPRADAPPPAPRVSAEPPAPAAPAEQASLPAAAEAPPAEPAPAPPVEPAPAPQEIAAAKPAAAETPPAPLQRERVLYFIRVDPGDGEIFPVKSSRKLPDSGAPLGECIRAIIAGPNAEEKRKGYITLIPPETKVLSVSIRNNIAYLNVSEDFLFNTDGAPGYEGQIKQVVWTATEFPSVSSVQILIEGKTIDFLGESMPIGRPLKRDDL
ncbi:MAG: GerMN domain-containing protein [Treponema sp.]|nr:GerMN domain-containing protein [Treponema sp.]